MCEMVCSFAHEGKFNPSASRIKVFKIEAKGIDVPIIDTSCDLCHMVGGPRCVKYCPTHVLRCVDIPPEEFHVLDRIRREIEVSKPST